MDCITSSLKDANWVIYKFAMRHSVITHIHGVNVVGRDDQTPANAVEVAITTPFGGVIP